MDDPPALDADPRCRAILLCSEGKHFCAGADLSGSAANDAEPGPDLDRVIAYDGAINYLHSTGLSLRFALMSIAAHHFQHVGEIVTIRSRLGHALKDSRDWGRGLI